MSAAASAAMTVMTQAALMRLPFLFVTRGGARDGSSSQASRSSGVLSQPCWNHSSARSSSPMYPKPAINEYMPAALAACASRSASPTNTHSPGFHADGLRGMQQRHRVRLAFGQRVAADDGAYAIVQLHFDQQRIGEPAGLVGDDAPGNPAPLERTEHLVAAFEQARVFGEALSVDVQQPHAHRFVRLGIQRAEAEPHQRMAAVRNLRAHGLERQRRELFLRAQLVQRFVEILRGVEQRAIEVEQHALDGAAHGATLAGRRVRCMR